MDRSPTPRALPRFPCFLLPFHLTVRIRSTSIYDNLFTRRNENYFPYFLLGWPSLPDPTSWGSETNRQGLDPGVQLVPGMCPEYFRFRHHKYPVGRQDRNRVKSSSLSYLLCDRDAALIALCLRINGFIKTKPGGVSITARPCSLPARFRVGVER